MVIDGAMDGEMFLAWMEQMLAPTLRNGDVVAGGVSGDVVVYDGRLAQELARFHPYDSNIAILEFAPDGRQLLVGSNDGTATIFEMPVPRALRALASTV